MPFPVSQLKTVNDHPDRYIIEFHDTLSHYLGEILPKPTIDKKGGRIWEIEFDFHVSQI